MADYTVTEEDFSSALDQTTLDEEIKTIVDEFLADVDNEVAIETIDPSTGEIIDVTTEVVYIQASVTETGNVEVTLGDVTFFVDASSSLAALFLNDGALTTTAVGPETAKIIIGTSLNDNLSIGKTAANIDAGAGDDTITTGFGEDIITAGLGNDSISSGSGNDKITINGSEAGNDSVDAGSGFDEVIINESANKFETVISGDGQLTLTSTSNAVTKTISNAEYISFQNASGNTVSAIVNTSSEVESFVARLYEAFGRFTEKDGIEYWVNEVTNGNTDLTHLAGSFLNTTEGQSVYSPDLGNALFVSKVYAQVLSRSLDDASKDWWVQQMQDGMTKAEVLAQIVSSDEAKSAFTYINNMGDDLV